MPTSITTDGKIDAPPQYTQQPPTPQEHILIPQPLIPNLQSPIPSSILPQPAPWTIIHLMNTNHIARFEEIVQQLVEGTFARLFAGRLRPLQVANALARAMEDQAVSRRGDLPLAPNHYWVALNPADHSALLAEQPHLADDLARHLFDLAHQAGFALPHPPAVSLTSQPGVSLHRVQVTARWTPPDDDASDDGTRQLALPSDRASDDPAPGTRPFLILEGQRHITLTGATVSLGRHLDNDVIVDDSRVSRRHAQLRRRYGRYVIYDLGSMGGTSVNGYPVQECVLEAGDVISLAGVNIIYGEDMPPSSAPPRGTRGTPALPRSSRQPETGEFPPSSADQPET
jgi:hypothetical protein